MQITMYTGTTITTWIKKKIDENLKRERQNHKIFIYLFTYYYGTKKLTEEYVANRHFYYYQMINTLTRVVPVHNPKLQC